MTNQKEREIASIADKVFKERHESMMKVVESKYEEIIKERASNDVHNQNFAVKQQYPEKEYLSFILKNGEFVVPFEANTYVTLEFYDGCNVKDVVQGKIKELDLDIKKLLDLCHTCDYCVVKTYTTQEVEMFDEELLEKEEKLARVKYDWNQVFCGMYRCEDVVGCYKTTARFEKHIDSEA